MLTSYEPTAEERATRARVDGLIRDIGARVAMCRDMIATSREMTSNRRHEATRFCLSLALAEDAASE